MPSPFTSAKRRGYLSWLIQLWAAPNAVSTKDGAAKLPLPVASASHTPPSPKPMMSARPSPFTSPSIRGYLSWLSQLWAAPKPFNTKEGAAKLPLLAASACHTPPSPKPMMSARPSPFTSAKRRGYLSALVQLCAEPNAPIAIVRSEKWPDPVAADTQTPALPNPTISALPSPFTSARVRGYWFWLLQL